MISGPSKRGTGESERVEEAVPPALEMGAGVTSPGMQAAPTAGKGKEADFPRSRQKERSPADLDFSPVRPNSNLWPPTL